MSLYILILAIFTACGNQTTGDKAQINVDNNNQVQIIADADAEENDIQSMIVGKFTKEDLMKAPFSSWFEKGYNEYQPTAEDLASIKENISDFEVVGFVGTWCPDSRRELPKLFKILDEAGYDLSKLTMVGVTRGKSTPENLEEGYNMHRVPTFIFLKDGKEVNRFVEYGVETIEKDIAKIVTGQEYKNAYAN
ncbi:thioredoxin family protein [Antarcticibacterium arcticum]|uniref:Thioredoxin family protein n=1 Tax=Antarcticibacterium arcticum TaxID=2585771 RepID=A0A5B8YKM3_9FLAO|nr:thioredoxin family protein [Antarcticibacterium arcticum]QED36249.1 thioredoxin family protein [Antarcticibacterium arcticum]